MARTKNGDQGPLGARSSASRSPPQLLARAAHRLLCCLPASARRGGAGKLPGGKPHRHSGRAGRAGARGLCERVRGIGTVVNRQIVALASRLDQKFEYNAMIRAAGYTSPMQTASPLQRRWPTAISAGRLGLEPGQPVLVVRKRVLADRQPVIWSVDYLPAALFPPSWPWSGWILPAPSLIS